MTRLTSRSSRTGPWVLGALSAVVREPLVHFLALGAGIFLLFSALSTSAPAPVERIEVTAERISQVKGRWARTWQRAPKPAELRGLIEEYVREEIYYREALALGLDADDTVVRRRLAQKFEFLTQDLAVPDEPTRADLLSYLELHKDRYARPDTFSFVQVYFNVDKRGSTAERHARAVLQRLQAESGRLDPSGLGDPSILDTSFERLTLRDIESIFGRNFAGSLVEAESGTWQGPIASGYGLHVVRLDARHSGREPRLAEIEEQVRADWIHERRQQAKEDIFRQLLARYTVVVEHDAAQVTAAAMFGAEQKREQ